MRVTASMTDRQTLRNLRAGATKYYKAQAAVSSQKNIIRPSDDPAGTIRAMRLRSRIVELTQYMSNTEDAAARLEVVDNSLSTISEVVQRLCSIAQDSVNSTNSVDDLNGMAIEASSLFDHLLREANVQSEDKYVFSGDSPWIKPFTDDGTGLIEYKGNGVRAEIKVDAGISVPVGLVGSELFSDTSYDGFGDLFQLAKDFLSDLQNGRAEKISSYIEKFDKADKHILGQRSAVGAVAGTLVQGEGLSARLGVDKQIAKDLLTNIEDIDFEEAVTNMVQQETIYQAALSVAGRVASKKSLIDYMK